MVHQISAGGLNINFIDGSWLVVNWCELFSPPVKPARMSDKEWFEMTDGSTRIPALSAKVANEQVPTTFTEAKAGGFLDGAYRREIDEDSFRQCREFLRFAAENGRDIEGSY